MKISVKSNGKRELFILLPSRLVFNRLTAACAAGIISRSLLEKGILSREVTSGELHRLFRTVIKFKRSHPGWNLVEVHSKEGDDVVVRL